MLNQANFTETEFRLTAVRLARRVQHLMDKRSIEVVNVAERFAYGKATEQELLAAWLSGRSTAQRLAEEALVSATKAPAALAAWAAAWTAAEDAMKASGFAADYSERALQVATTM